MNSILRRAAGTGHGLRQPFARPCSPEPAALCLGAFAGVVADVPGRDDEDDVLGDVGGVVADALEVARDQDQIERRLDGRRDPASM